PLAVDGQPLGIAQPAAAQDVAAAVLQPRPPGDAEAADHPLVVAGDAAPTQGAAVGHHVIAGAVRADLDAGKAAEILVTAAPDIAADIADLHRRGGEGHAACQGGAERAP